MKKITVLILMCLMLVCVVLGQAESDPQDKSGEVYRYLDFVPDLRLWGAKIDFSLGLGLLPGIDSGLWTRLSGAWETVGYYQAPDGLSPPLTAADNEAVQYSRWDFKGGVGVFQGLHFDPLRDRNDLELLAAWMYQYDIADPAIGPADLIHSSQGQILNEGGLSYFMVDLCFDGVVKTPETRIKKGVYAEAYTEFAPEGFYSASNASWIRLGGLAKGLLPVFESTRKVTVEGKPEPEVWNEFSAYLAGHILYDQLIALNDTILPNQITYVTGGMLYRYGLGDLVRGLSNGYLAGTSKCVGNLEFRLVGPAFIHKDIVPILLAYYDAGFSYNESDGFRYAMGTGIGLMVDLVGFAEVGLYTQWNFPDLNDQGTYWTPVAIGFGFHF